MKRNSYYTNENFQISVKKYPKIFLLIYEHAMNLEKIDLQVYV